MSPRYRAGQNWVEVRDRRSELRDDAIHVDAGPGGVSTAGARSIAESIQGEGARGAARSGIDLRVYAAESAARFGALDVRLGDQRTVARPSDIEVVFQRQRDGV